MKLTDASDKESSIRVLPSESTGRGPSPDLPTGIAADHALPHEPFSNLWDAILIESDQKDRLLGQALLSLTLRPRITAAALPLHGLILLSGPPGTGKTSLARGLASRTAESFGGSNFQYLEVEPHALANAGLGRSQQAVRRLLNEVIAERAELGPLVVLLDEVEALAPDRARMSLEANPIDVHRATDAVLAGLDQLATSYPRLLFLATSNFMGAIDVALLSRADLVEKIPLPGPDTARAILKDTIEALSDAFPEARRVLADQRFAQAAVACAGLDGRQIRKVVATACASDKRTALNPGLLTGDALLQAAEGAHRSATLSVAGDGR